MSAPSVGSVEGASPSDPSFSSTASPVISWQPGWRELDLVIGLAVDAAGAQTLLDPAAFSTRPRAGIQLADVVVVASAAGDRLFAGVGSQIDGSGGDDELFNSNSLGSNLLVGGRGADRFFLRPVHDRIIGGELFSGAATLGLSPFTALVDREQDTFLIDSSDPGSSGSLQILDFEPGVDVLLVDGAAPAGDWSAVRQQLQGVNVLVNAAPELRNGPVVINLRRGEEVSQDLKPFSFDRDDDPLQLLKLSGPDWIQTNGTVLKATVPGGLSEEQLASTPLLLGFSDGKAIVSLPVQLTLATTPTGLELTNSLTSLAENTSTTSPIKLADIAISGESQGSTVINLSGADAASFELIGNELFLKAGTILDFETQPAYALTLSASDPTLPSRPPVTAAFSLAITDVNEPPQSNGIASISASENDPDIIVDLLSAFTDPDQIDSELNYSLTLNSNPQLVTTAIDQLTGSLRLSFAESKTGTAQITVQARDSQSQSASSDFTVSVRPLDANNDGIPDRQQANVLAVPIPGQGFVTFVAEAGGAIPTIGSTANPDPANTPPGLQFAEGFFAIQYEGLPSGAATKLNLLLPRGSNANSYWKYGPTTPAGQSEWYNFSFDPLTGTGAKFADLNGDGQLDITLHFVDGKRGDDDLIANGRISDPGAPAFDPASVEPIGKPIGPDPIPGLLPGKPTPSPQPQPTGPSRIRATELRDRLIGTSAVDTFIFRGVQSTSTKRRLQFDTITNFAAQDRIAFRAYNERLMGSANPDRIRRLQGTAKDLNVQSLRRVLGAEFKGQTIGALEIRGFDGTFLAVNGGRRKVEGGRPGFDRRDMLIWLEGYDIDRQGPVLLA